MRRLIAAAAISALTVLVVPGLAAASHSSGPGGSRDFAVGGGTFGDPSDPTSVQRVDFAASGGPSPFEPVTGHFRAGGAFDQLGITGFQQEGPVTCLVVERNTARLVYSVKQAIPEGNENLEILIFIEDNGPPVNGQPVDELGFVPLPDTESPENDPPSEQDSECVPQPPPPPADPAPFTLEKGNFTVHDAP